MNYCKNMRQPDNNGLIGCGIKFERVRRITGYLNGTVEHFNNAKQAEVEDRLLHSMSSQPGKLKRDCGCGGRE